MCKITNIIFFLWQVVKSMSKRRNAKGQGSQPTNDYDTMCVCCSRKTFLVVLLYSRYSKDHLKDF